jgi:hypothetical protein
MRQPSGSKIILTSDPDRLELTIPARFRPDRAGVHQIGLTAGVTLLTLLLTCLIIYISIPLSIPTTELAVRVGLSVALLFTVPLTLWLGKASFKLLFDLADKFLSHTIIAIDRQQFTLSNYLFTLERARPKTLKTREISQVMVDTYQNTDVRQKKIGLLFELRQAESVRLLSSGQDITTREIKWLAAELSHWLGVDLVNDRVDLDRY